MNELKIFKNEEFGEVRSLSVDSDPWFVGKDVARALGYGEGKSLNNAIARHVDEEDKGVTEMVTPGGKQNVIIINESGLYSLVLSSKLPTAKKFKRWVTSEVLPTLRRTGTYSIQHDPMQALRLMFEATEQIEARVTQLESVQTISQNEYSEIGTRIQKRINNVIKDEGLIVRGNQRRKLFNEFNHEVLLVGGVKHRNQILKKDYYKILDFINDWQPSRATIIGVLGYEQQAF